MNKKKTEDPQENTVESICKNPSEGKAQFVPKVQKKLSNDSKLEWLRSEYKDLIDASLDQISEKYERAFGAPESIDLNFRDLRVIDSEQYEVTCIIYGKGFRGLAQCMADLNPPSKQAFIKLHHPTNDQVMRHVVCTAVNHSEQPSENNPRLFSFDRGSRPSPRNASIWCHAVRSRRSFAQRR